MSSYTPCSMNSNGLADMGQPIDVQKNIQRLKTLAVNGLPPMFDPEHQLFCHKLKKTADGLVREGLSRRYTMITLMGLHRLEESGESSPIAIQPVLANLLADTKWVDNIGDLGLLLWTCALIAPDRLSEVARRLDAKNALNHFRDARQGRTMELAWFLAGLSHGLLACPQELPELKESAFATYSLIKRNQGEQGTFRHVARTRSVFDKLRSGIGTFADQVYPIYAMTRFWQATQFDQAKESALDCALAICEAQGSLGQWWWHYDASNGGGVVGKFPVYSVHQHGMAPMALLVLGEAIQSDFSPWIYKGLHWIEDNELGFEMEDDSAKLVWRCISPSNFNRYWSVVAGKLFHISNPVSSNEMIVVLECRPYELGWLLYAFAK